jgi:hypothetical protein
MKFTHNRSLLSRLIVLVSAFAILTTQTAFVFAVSKSRTAAGEITVSGPAKSGEKPFVLVNGDPAFSGRTFFSGGTITTESSSATIDFGKMGRVELAPGSTVSLSVEAGVIFGTLSNGNLSVSYADGVEVKISTPHDTVTTEQKSGGNFAVGVTPDATTVTSGKGLVRYNNGRTIAGTQDDDDDHDHDDWTWIAIVAVGAAVTALIVYVALRDEEEVSPVR